MVPLTLKMLGVYNNGVWLTISGILIWIDFMDIGLGNGLRNTVAQYVAIGDDEKARRAVSSTFFILTLIIIPMLLLFCALVQLLNMHSILGVSPTVVPNLNAILIVALVMTSVTFILKAIGNLYMGLQLPAVSNLIMCLGQTLSLIVTFTAYMLGCRSLLYVVLINTLTREVSNAEKATVPSGEANGIASPTTDATAVSSTTFDLAGRPVGNARRGIVIQRQVLSDGTARTRKVVLP